MPLKTHRADACLVLLLLFLFVWNRQPETCAPTSILSAPSSVVSPGHRVARQGPRAHAAHPPLPPHTWNDASLSFSDRLTSRGLTSSRLVPVTPRGWTSFFTAERCSMARVNHTPFTHPSTAGPSAGPVSWPWWAVLSERAGQPSPEGLNLILLETCPAVGWLAHPAVPFSVALSGTELRPLSPRPPRPRPRLCCRWLADGTRGPNTRPT